MESKTAGAIVIIAASFFFIGRLSAPSKVKIEKENIYIAERLSDKDTISIGSKTILEVVKPDGTKITRTKVDASSKTVQSTRDLTASKVIEYKTIEQKKSVSIALMAGVDTNNLGDGLMQGVHIYAPVAGPIFMGAWWFFNRGTLGISAGIQF